jgi:hypothetical protein
MRTIAKLVAVASLLIAGGLVSGAAMAHGARFGVWIGGPVWGPWYPPYYPYYYPQPVVVAPPAPPVYIDNGTSTAPPPASASTGSSWYFCRNPQGYYPYVKECPGGGWERVPSQPPR